MLSSSESLLIVVVFVSSEVMLVVLGLLSTPVFLIIREESDMESKAQIGFRTCFPLF